jgi:hypothetical protein
VGQTVEKRPLLVVVRQGEQLLELVHDQQQLAAPGHDAVHHPVDPLLAGRQLAGQIAGLDHRDPAQRLCQLLERRRPRHHGGHEPVLGSPACTPAHLGQQPGANQARLAATRAAHHQDQPSPRSAAGEAGQDLVHQPVTAEEVVGVGLVERPQPLVGVGWLVHGPTHLARQGRHHGGDEVLELRRLRLRQGRG